VPSLQLYSALLLAAGLVVAPVAALMCLLRPAWRRGLASRFGIGWPRPASENVLWVHAASVGEVEGVAPLVRRWRDAYPGGEVVLSALTATGCDAARRLVPEAHVRAFPLDLPWITRAVVRRVRPRLFLFSENELWPNAIAALARAGVPVVQVSGRLSARAARTLARFPGLAGEILGRVSRFCVQEDEHRERLLALGVAADRVLVTGSLKGADRVPAVAPIVPLIARVGRPVVVAGSTHAGEETALLDALARWGGAGRPLLVLAPRHPERFSQVASLLERRGVPYVRRSRLGADREVRSLAESDVLLLDSMGELAGSYSAAAVAFVGGTLVPIGGHNVLEAARAGAPVVVGPHYEHVRATIERLVSAGAAAVAASSAELGAAIDGFLESPTAGAARDAARRIALEETGGLEATWNAIGDLTRAVGVSERTGAAPIPTAASPGGASLG
jgi:3-deoxy-D-manno-octulosonic-acid transferase